MMVFDHEHNYLSMHLLSLIPRLVLMSAELSQIADRVIVN